MFRAFVILILGVGASLQSRALDSADVLPAHVNSPQLKVGVISGIGQRYTDSGSLMSLTDLNSMTFDSARLVQLEPRVQQLVNVLNQFGQQNMGTALTLGTLHINTEPTINYLAPVHAFGVTEKWTLAVGVPVLRYKNQITLSQSGSNLDVIRDHAGGISPELDSAFDELNVGLAASAQKMLATKGYKPLQSRNDSFVGDVQLVNLYQLYNNKRTAILSKTTLNLPTGPSDDPDDLTDLASFGYTAVEQTGLITYMVTPKFRLSGLATARYTFADKISKRVPTSADDGLPDSSTKEDVNRSTGTLAQLGVSSMFWFLNRWSAGAGLDIGAKAADQYSGSRGTRYDLLEANTNQTFARVRFGVTYDTISAYLAKKAFMPGMISYTFSDTVRGLNIERQTVHELWFTMFF